jgi:hypothetical protein
MPSAGLPMRRGISDIGISVKIVSKAISLIDTINGIAYINDIGYLCKMESEMIAKRHTLANALRIAAKQYEDDGRVAAATPRHERMEEMFKEQAREAWVLADEIEQSDSIHLED